MRLLFVLAFVVVCTAQGRVCCYPPLGDGFAEQCTENIPLVLCERAKGKVHVDEMPAEDPPCCCFGRNAGPLDECLPDVPTSVCQGMSVQGTCKPSVPNRCCCRPAGESNDALCVRNIPTALCEKAVGAECVAGSTDIPLAPTPAPPCRCRIPGQTGALVMPELTCEKFGGVCLTTPPVVTPTKCCCIWDGATMMNGNPVRPTDPGVPALGLCVKQTDIATCNGDDGKRSGACWTGPVPPTPAPEIATCKCVDPDSATGEFIKDPVTKKDLDILVEVCENKLKSKCWAAGVCCKFPSNANGVCLDGIEETRCLAIPGARIVQKYVKPDTVTSKVLPANIMIYSEDQKTDCAKADTEPRVTLTVKQPTISTTTVENLVPLLKLNDDATFIYPLEKDTKVFKMGSTQTVSVSAFPAVEGLLFYALNWRGAASATGTITYQMEVKPASALPVIASGMIDGASRVAVVVPLGNGKYSITCEGLGVVSGIFRFSQAVKSVSVTNPPTLAVGPQAAVAVSLISQGGRIAKLPSSTGTFSSPQVLLGQTDTNVVKPAPSNSPACDEVPPAAVSAVSVSLAGVTFPTGKRPVITIKLPTPFPVDQTTLFAGDFAKGEYSIFQTNLGNVASKPPFVESGTGVTIKVVAGEVIMKIDNAATDAKVRFFGQPTEIKITLPVVTAKRKRITNAETSSMHLSIVETVLPKKTADATKDTPVVTPVDSYSMM